MAQLAFMIQVVIHVNNIHYSIVDEGYSTCIMFLSCWKDIGCPQLNQSPTTLKDFDGRGFKPYGIINLLLVELGGKNVSVEFKVIDEPLDYSLLLGHTWVYVMATVVSTYFKTVAFPHKGGIVSIDQLTLFATNSEVTGSIPLVGETPHPYQHVRVGLLKDSSLI